MSLAFERTPQMPYVVTEDCIKCKYMDCVDICPVHCFYEGENMLVINPEQCIDCAACEETCPVDAIVSDTDLNGEPDWLSINRKYSALWPNILKRGTPPTDAKSWKDIAHKFATQFNPNPARG